MTSDLFPEIAEVPRRAPETSLGKGFSEAGVPTTHLPNNVEIRFERVGKGKAEFVWERGWVPLFCIARMTDLSLGGAQVSVSRVLTEKVSQNLWSSCLS